MVAAGQICIIGVTPDLLEGVRVQGAGFARLSKEQVDSDRTCGVTTDH